MVVLPTTKTYIRSSYDHGGIGMEGTMTNGFDESRELLRYKDIPYAQIDHVRHESVGHPKH